MRCARNAVARSASMNACTHARERVLLAFAKHDARRDGHELHAKHVLQIRLCIVENRLKLRAPLLQHCSRAARRSTQCRPVSLPFRHPPRPPQPKVARAFTVLPDVGATERRPLTLCEQRQTDQRGDHALHVLCKRRRPVASARAHCQTGTECGVKKARPRVRVLPLPSSTNERDDAGRPVPALPRPRGRWRVRGVSECRRVSVRRAVRRGPSLRR